MTNISTTTSLIDQNHDDLLVTYYPFALVISGTLFNGFTFIILCRSTFQDTQKRPSLHYMRTIAIFDIFILYGWNLNRYLVGAHGFDLQYYTVPVCRIYSFWNYFTGQVSAWLRVFICFNRYMSLSRLHKTCFNQSRNVLIIIACILIFFLLLNFHFFLFVCYYDKDGTVNVDAPFYSVYPLWDYMNLVFYNCAPFLLMAIFNSGVIYHLFLLHKTRTLQHSQIHHRSITITLVITTFLFLIMTTLATICFAFFSAVASDDVLCLVDCILYTYHILSFFTYLITFGEFRREVIRLITCSKRHMRKSTVGGTKSCTVSTKTHVI